MGVTADGDREIDATAWLCGAALEARQWRHGLLLKMGLQIVIWNWIFDWVG